jgi:hypothetical protein
MKHTNTNKTQLLASNYVMERYSHKGYLIKVVAMALAGEVVGELSPIQSWSNRNYEV